MAHTAMTYIVMAYIVMACIVMVCTVMVYIVMAYRGMTWSTDEELLRKDGPRSAPPPTGDDAELRCTLPRCLPSLFMYY